MIKYEIVKDSIETKAFEGDAWTTDDIISAYQADMNGCEKLVKSFDNREEAAAAFEKEKTRCCSRICGAFGRGHLLEADIIALYAVDYDEDGEPGAWSDVLDMYAEPIAGASKDEE